MQLKIAEEAEASRIIARIRAERHARLIWLWGGLGFANSTLILLFFRPITLALIYFASLAGLTLIFAGAWRHQRAVNQSVQHHNRGLTVQNHILNAQLETARRAQCPDPKCSKCRAELVRRRADFVMQQYGRLHPKAGKDDQ